MELRGALIFLVVNIIVFWLIYYGFVKFFGESIWKHYFYSIIFILYIYSVMVDHRFD